MVIAKTASRNVVYKTIKLGKSILERQSEMLMPEEELELGSNQENTAPLFFQSSLSLD